VSHRDPAVVGPAMIDRESVVPAVVGPAMIDRESVVLPVAVLEGVVPQTVAAVGHAVAARVAGFRDGCE